MSPFYTILVHDQGHYLAFPINPDHPQSLISHITLTMQPLIPDTVGATSSLLQPQEYSENVRVEFGLEGVELEEVYKLPLEEVEVSEQPLEEVLDEVLGWKECMVVLGTAGMGSE